MNDNQLGLIDSLADERLFEQERDMLLEVYKAACALRGDLMAHDMEPSQTFARGWRGLLEMAALPGIFPLLIKGF